MLKASRLKDLLVVIVLVTLVAGVSHLVITNPLGPSRLLYYAQAHVVQWNTRCSPEAPDWMARAQRYATRSMAAPASQLAYVSPDGRLHHCETGWKDGILGDQPLQPDTRFRFASTTKTVTAAAILDLVNEGELSLDQSIVRLLALEGELKDPRVADITVGHLLSHRGGWDREQTQDVMFMRNHRPWCPNNPEELLDSGLMYDPGETELYSNLGYCLLGLAIEQVSGQSYRNYVADRLTSATAPWPLLRAHIGQMRYGTTSVSRIFTPRTTIRPSTLRHWRPQRAFPAAPAISPDWSARHWTWSHSPFWMAT